LPIDAERRAQWPCLVLDPVLAEADDRHPALHALFEMPVAGAEDAVLGKAMRNDLGVGHAALGNRGIIAGRA